MKKSIFLFLLALLLTVPQSSHAYNKGDSFTINGIAYEVTDIANREVRVIGISSEALNENQEVTIPSTVFDGIDQTFAVKSVGRWTNTWNTDMKKLTLSEGIESIASGAAFCDARSLQTIYLPVSLKTITSPVAFALLPELKEIIVNENNKNFCSDDGILYNKSKTELIRYPTKKEIGNNGVYSIPNDITKVWAGAYLNNLGLKEVHIPESVLELQIGTYNVFTGCRNLTSIIVSEGNTKYKDIDGVLCDNALATLITYPEGKIDKEYTIPNGIKKIESNCFYYASQLQKVNLNNVEEISEKGFNVCNSLTEISISANMTNITEGGFYSCINIQKYTVDTGNEKYSDIDGVLCNKEGTTLLLFPLGRTEDYTIPEKITEIAKMAFHNSNLTKVTISKNVKTIGAQAFRQSKIEEIEFEESSSLKTIGKSCFWECKELKEIAFPLSLETIENSAFLDCQALTTVIIPNGSELTDIMDNAFEGCTALENVIFGENCKLQSIGGSAFSKDLRLKKFIFPASVTTIGGSAFSGCKGMSTVEFPTNAVISTIGRNSFDGCGLERIEIPSSVVAIEAEAFKNCDKLTSVNIPTNTTLISPEAFKYCKSLTNINVSTDNKNYSSVDGMLLSKDKETLLIFPAGKANDTFTLLPPSITKIGNYAFYDCSNLKNVTIPNKVTSIGQRAFGLCSSLNTITFLCDDMINPANIDQELNTKSFDDNMFAKIDINVRKEKMEQYGKDEYYKQFKSITPSFLSANENEEYIAVSDNAVDLLSTRNTDYTYILPSEVTHNGKTFSVALIGDYAFQNVGADMKEIVVSKNVAYIGAKAFKTNIEKDESTIENIFFLSTNPGTETLSTLRFNLKDTGKDYGEFANNQKIYVKKSAVGTYREVWKEHEKAIDYKIPGISISKKYGTFAREFDTYIGEYTENEANEINVMAFIGGDYREGNGDYGPETEYHIHMESIEAAGYNGLYIPKNTGVLLKVMNEEATPKGYYYCIGENDDMEHNVTKNAMKGVTINNNQISGYDKWVIQGGQFRALNGQTVQMPVHKAYLELDGVPSSAKIVFSFDDGSTTGVENIEIDNNSKAVYYNLNGMRVTNPQKGVYIRNGKKTVIK